MSVFVTTKDLPDLVPVTAFKQYLNFRDAFRCADNGDGHIHFFSEFGYETFAVCFDKECLEE